MEAAVKSVIAQPAWAHDFCYYFLAAAVVTAVYGIYVIFQMMTLPGLIKRLVPTTSVTIALVLSIGLSVVLSMMQFWICRSALAPSDTKAEKFAVKCASDADCGAVAGGSTGSGGVKVGELEFVQRLAQDGHDSTSGEGTDLRLRFGASAGWTSSSTAGTALLEPISR
jgi:hypothetical protein